VKNASSYRLLSPRQFRFKGNTTRNPKYLKVTAQEFSFGR